MPTKSSVGPKLDEGGVALYWDPRYQSYFYAGIMTPPTGQLYDFTATAITLPTDTHTWSMVELEPPDANDMAPSPGPPILLRPDQMGQGGHRNQGRGITWGLPEYEPRIMEVERERARSGWDMRAILCYLVIAVLTITAIALGIMIAFRVLTSTLGDSSPSSDTDFSDAGFIDKAYHRRLVWASSRPPRKRAAEEQTTNSSGVVIQMTANNFLASTTGYMIISPYDPYVGAPVTKPSADRSHSDFKTPRNVCLVASSKSQLRNHEVNTSLSGEYENCDAVIPCCYSLPINLSIGDWDTTHGGCCRNDRATAGKGVCRTSTLLGVYAGDDSAFQRILFSYSGERAKFVQGILQTAQKGTFCGVRLWVPPHEHATRGFYKHLVLLAQDIATKLQRVDYTFGFFLSHGLLSGQWGFVAALTKVLNAPYSILLYAEFREIHNTTASTYATWPTPEEVLAHASLETGAMRGNSSVCYLLPVPVAVQARLAERCNLSKTQFVTRATYVTLPMLADVCRKLHLDPSWLTSVREYHTITCKDSWAFLYQTPRQMRLFREDLLAAAPSSACVGSFDDFNLPGACNKIYSVSG